MKFQVGDQVLVTAGKDKGKKSSIIKVLPKSGKVVVKDVNLYVRHVKKMADRAGEIVKRERALDTAKVAVINDKGQPDRIGYQVSKDGQKQRVFKKTGKVIETKKAKAK